MTCRCHHAPGTNITRLAILALLLAGGLLTASGAMAQTGGHGPDAWRVLSTSLAGPLHARTGPGRNYPDRQATFAAGERGLQQNACVPTLSQQQFMRLDTSTHRVLPMPWCLMTSSDGRRSGWVPREYLAEDADPVNRPAAFDAHSPEQTGQAARIVGVALQNDLEGRAGPGRNYPVTMRFGGDQLVRRVTCVPLPASGSNASANPDWCLVHLRNTHASTETAWIPARFVRLEANAPKARDITVDATTLVRNLYAAAEQARNGQGRSPLAPGERDRYFFSDLVALLDGCRLGANPLYGAQDFQGRVESVKPVFARQGMVLVEVVFSNYGQRQKASYAVRADPSRAGAPLRIMAIEQQGQQHVIRSQCEPSAGGA